MIAMNSPAAISRSRRCTAAVKSPNRLTTAREDNERIDHVRPIREMKKTCARTTSVIDVRNTSEPMAFTCGSMLPLDDLQDDDRHGLVQTAYEPGYRELVEGNRGGEAGGGDDGGGGRKAG